MAQRAFAFSPETYARLRARRIAAALADATSAVVRAFQLCETDAERRDVKSVWSRCLRVQSRFEAIGAESV
jgi:hypothetical protein